MRRARLFHTHVVARGDRVRRALDHQLVAGEPGRDLDLLAEVAARGDPLEDDLAVDDGRSGYRRQPSCRCGRRAFLSGARSYSSRADKYIFGLVFRIYVYL